MSDWNEVKRVTDAATPGPWRRQNPERVIASDSHETIGTFDITADADFITLARTALPEALALLVEAREQIRDLAEAAHQTGSVRDHWCDPKTGKVGTGPVDFDVCDDAYCAEARDLIARLPEGE